MWCVASSMPELVAMRWSLAQQIRLHVSGLKQGHQGEAAVQEKGKVKEKELHRGCVQLPSRVTLDLSIVQMCWLLLIVHG